MEKENGIEIENIQEYITLLEKLSQEHLSEGDLLLFRGENQEYDKYCQPGLFRYFDKNNRVVETKVYNALKSFEHVSYEKNDLEIAVDAQHGEVPTRLLDLSLNSLVALYFAVESSDDKLNTYDGNSCVYVFKPSKLYDIKDESIANFFSSYIHNESSKPISHSNNQLIFLHHSKQNDRVDKQQGCFAMSFNYNKKIVDNYIIKKIYISKENSKQIKKSLRNIFGITQSYIFPEIINSKAAIVDEINTYEVYHNRTPILNDVYYNLEKNGDLLYSIDGYTKYINNYLYCNNVKSNLPIEMIDIMKHISRILECSKFEKFDQIKAKVQNGKLKGWIDNGR